MASFSPFPLLSLLLSLVHVVSPRRFHRLCTLVLCFFLVGPWQWYFCLLHAKKFFFLSPFYYLCTVFNNKLFYVQIIIQQACEPAFHAFLS